MADQVLKTVRITDDMKVEVCQQGKKRKYALFYDSGNSDINRRRSDTDNTKSEKYDVAMSDDDVIEMALKAYNSRFGTPQKKFYITQKTYSNPAPVRTYGNGDKSPYYINNGCAINIQWVGRLTNPEFNPGTYSNLYQAERAGRTNGKPRYLENVTITATSDDATNSDILPKSSWSVSPPIIDDLFGKDEVTVDYRDKSNVFHKVVTVTLPKDSTEGGGKGYLVWTEDGLQYESKSIPENTPASQFSGIDKSGYGGRIGRPENQIVYFRDSDKDKDVLDRVISDFKFKVVGLQGISLADYDLKLCAPDNETCSLIPYKSPLEKSGNATASQTQVGSTQSAPPPKIKFTIDGLGDEIILKAKQDLDTFTIWTGPIPKVNNGSGNVDDYEDELGEEYKETDAIITDEQQIVLDLQVYLTQGDSEGTEDDVPTATTTGGGGGVNTKGSNAGGSGDRRFQQQLTIRGRVVKNGEIPSDLLAKVDFGGYLLEKHAAVKFSALNKAFKEKFGKNFTISGPYRPFNVGNSIFDWDYFNKTGKGRKIGTNGGTAAAKPGTSKHGWGQAMDIGGFGNGPGNQYFDWMEQNAKRYGWINPAWAKKSGAGYEPWHWEYIGDDLFAA
jgi:hypothetical protein